MRHENITVQIMAGGKSTRMGEDKALVELNGKTLLELALERWKDFGGAVQVSVGPAERKCLAPAGVPAVVDHYAQMGPLGGLHAGLLACRTELLLLVAVDIPFVTAELAEGLAAAIGEKDACIYALDGRPQPLFGLYRKSCLPAAEKMLTEGERKMGLLLRRVDTMCLPAEDPGPFRNLNTPEELEAARKAVWV